MIRRPRWLRLPHWTCPYCGNEIAKGADGKEYGHEGWCGG